MKKNYIFDEMLETLEKLRDINIYHFDDKTLAKFYQGWIDQFNEGKVTCPKFYRWLELQYDYHNQKNREKGAWIKSLLEVSQVNAEDLTKGK